MHGFFITGTDTDIGKTALSPLLLAELRRRNINAAPMKPAQTGCEPRDQRTANREQTSEEPSQSLKSKAQGLLSVPDLDYSLSMAGMEVSVEDYALMAPYCFEPACSPHLAAEMAGTEIRISEIVKAAAELGSEYDLILAEGAGGILVPLNRQELMLDLMKALNLPVLLAARPGLGTINHTLLSIRALREEGLELAGIVLVESNEPQRGIIEEDNITTIEQFGEVSILGTIPFCPALREPAPSYNALPVTVVAEVEKIVNQLTI